MKAIIDYLGDFTIPKKLPHAWPEKGVDTQNCDRRVFDDAVFVIDHPKHRRSALRLSSNHGVTDIWDWVEYADHFTIPKNGRAWYNGARNALNAVCGIEFPECTVTKVESTIGHFRNLEDYDRARGIILPLMRAVERFIEVPHNNDWGYSAKVAQANTWLANLENALRPVIDMNDPCRNPIHADGTKGYLA
jgi:hypothetical protein